MGNMSRIRTTRTLAGMWSVFEMLNIGMDRMTAEKLMSLLLDTTMLDHDAELLALYEQMEDMGLAPRYDLINGVLEHR